MKTSIVKQLQNKYGGVWKHIPFQGMWVCEGINLHACFVAEGGYDINGNYVDVPEIFARTQPLRVYGTDLEGNKINGHKFRIDRS